MKLLLLTSLLAVAFTVTAAAQDLKEPKSADELWAQIEKLQEPPATRPESREEMEKVYNEIIAKLEPALAHFVKTYPAETRSWPARMMLAKLALSRS
jgi:hypothetical protein